MDKDYIWKLEITLKKKIDDFVSKYNCTIVLDPTQFEENCKQLRKQATGKQWNLLASSLPKDIASLQNKYDEESKLFNPVQFVGKLIKFEDKWTTCSLIINVNNEAAQSISKLVNNLDKAAICLSKVSI